MSLASVKKDLLITVAGTDVAFTANVYSLVNSRPSNRVITTCCEVQRRQKGYYCPSCFTEDPETMTATMLGPDYIPVPPIPADRKPDTNRLHLTVFTAEAAERYVPAGKVYTLMTQNVQLGSLASLADDPNLTLMGRWAPRQGRQSMFRVGLFDGYVTLQEVELAKVDPMGTRASTIGAYVHVEPVDTDPESTLPDPHAQHEAQVVLDATSPKPDAVDSMLADLAALVKE